MRDLRVGPVIARSPRRRAEVRPIETGPGSDPVGRLVRIPNQFDDPSAGPTLATPSCGGCCCCCCCCVTTVVASPIWWGSVAADDAANADRPASGPVLLALLALPVSIGVGVAASQMDGALSLVAWASALAGMLTAAFALAGRPAGSSLARAIGLGALLVACGLGEAIIVLLGFGAIGEPAGYVWVLAGLLVVGALIANVVRRSPARAEARQRHRMGAGAPPPLLPDGSVLPPGMGIAPSSTWTPPVGPPATPPTFDPTPPGWPSAPPSETGGWTPPGPVPDPDPGPAPDPRPEGDPPADPWGRPG